MAVGNARIAAVADATAFQEGESMKRNMATLRELRSHSERSCVHLAKAIDLFNQGVEISMLLTMLR
jgi:hypothetical protein